MKRFGYLPASEKSESLYKESALVDAIKSLQKFGNIPMSGEIDNKTLEVIFFTSINLIKKTLLFIFLIK